MFKVCNVRIFYTTWGSTFCHVSGKGLRFHMYKNSGCICSCLCEHK